MIEFKYVSPGGREYLLKGTILYNMPGYKIVQFTNPITGKLEEKIV